MNAFAWLLKREFWEHRGGFLWAPLVTAAVFIGMLLVALISAEFFNKTGIHIGVPLKQLISQIPPEHMDKVAMGADMTLASLAMIMHTVLFFVLFFYLLGALYDDRRDRSVLFWKSLPLSDLETVLSKVAMATLVAPILAFLATVLFHIVFLGVLGIYALLHGVNPITVLWGPAEPMLLWAKMAAMIPVNALWALPSIGWLLLVSSWSRSKPFLWAVLPLVLIGIINNIFELTSAFRLPDVWFWKHIVLRALFSIAPGSASLFDGSLEDIDFEKNPVGMLSWQVLTNPLTSPELWIGAVAGVAMIAGAVFYRRYRDDS